MGYRIERSNSDSGPIKNVRLQTPGVRTSQFKLLVRAPELPVRASSEPTNLPHVAPLARAAEESSPEARACKATRRLRQPFENANRAAKRQARLCRADEYEILRRAYAAVRCWQQDGVTGEIERELRAQAHVTISQKSNLFLVLFRSAPPRLDAKKASKWAGALQLADHHEVKSKRLAAFLYNSGGIEGAARAIANLRARTDP